MSVFHSGTVASGNITATFYAAILSNYLIQKDIIGSSVTFSSNPGTVKPASNAILSYVGYDSIIAVFDLTNLGTSDQLTLDSCGAITY